MVEEVKYLDREDIKSLGFELVWNEWNENVYELGKFRLFDNKQFKYLMITEKVDSNPILFKGTIKNKSELKRILKQMV